MKHSCPDRNVQSNQLFLCTEYIYIYTYIYIYIYIYIYTCIYIRIYNVILFIVHVKKL